MSTGEFTDFEQLALEASRTTGRKVSVGDVARALPADAHDPFDMYDLAAVVRLVRHLPPRKARHDIEAQLRAHAVEAAYSLPRVLNVDAPLRLLLPRATRRDRERAEDITLRCLLLTCGDWPSVGNVLAGRFKKAYQHPRDWEEFEDQVDDHWAKQTAAVDPNAYHRAAHRIAALCMNRAAKNVDRNARREEAEWRVFLYLWMGTPVLDGDLDSPKLTPNKSFRARHDLLAARRAVAGENSLQSLIDAVCEQSPTKNRASFHRLAYRATSSRERVMLRAAPEPDEFVLFGKRWRCLDLPTLVASLTRIQRMDHSVAGQALKELAAQDLIVEAPSQS